MSLEHVTHEYTGDRRLISLVTLIVANILPLIGVLFYDWDVAALVVLYWSENLVLGFYTLAKMLVTSPVGGVFSGLFFLIHYGGFCAVHGLFIVTLLVDPEADVLAGGQTWPFFFVFVELLVDVVSFVLAQAPTQWLWAFAALFISHGVSFVLNFLLAREREKTALNALMTAPYGRIIVMHIAVILGAMAITALGQPLFMLLILVVLKTAVDIALHLREHQRLAAGGNTAST